MSASHVGAFASRPAFIHTPLLTTFPMSRRKPSTFTPTAEQRVALDLFKTGRSLKLVAFAGAGKTTTLSLLAHSSQAPGIYITYNRSIADASRGHFPTSVDCRTTHSLAWTAVQAACNYSTSKMKNRVFPEQLRRELDIKDRNVGDVLLLDGRQQAFLVLQTLKRFCYSSDEELSIRHVVPCGKLVGVPRECREELDEWVLSTAQRVWAMMTSSRDPMPLGHDGYQKVWSLQAPVLSCEYLLLDEAQDTNEVVLGVLRRQKCQIVYVGDPHQQIYSWRGAVNAMESLPATSEAALTQSL